MINHCVHYELFRPDFPAFKDRAYSKQTLINRARKHWSNCTINIVKVVTINGFENPTSVCVIDI